MKMQRVALDQARVEGECVLKLIEQAAPPPVGSAGQGTHVNTYG
ncbi:MAG: hypothetical protein ABI867_20835 [Kofleriaceae bacterium]